MEVKVTVKEMAYSVMFNVSAGTFVGSVHRLAPFYCSIALQMEHCYLAITINLKWEF